MEGRGDVSCDIEVMGGGCKKKDAFPFARSHEWWQMELNRFLVFRNEKRNQKDSQPCTLTCYIKTKWTNRRRRRRRLIQTAITLWPLIVSLPAVYHRNALDLAHLAMYLPGSSAMPTWRNRRSRSISLLCRRAVRRRRSADICVFQIGATRLWPDWSQVLGLQPHALYNLA
jgi:hypothetical protein